MSDSHHFCPFLSAQRPRDDRDVDDENEGEEDEEEDVYESIYEEVGPPGRNGGGGDDADQFYGSESDFDEIDDEKVIVLKYLLGTFVQIIFGCWLLSCGWREC